MTCRILSVSLLAGLSACQGMPKPAVLTDASPETMATVTGVLAAAVDRAQIELGAGDPTQDTFVSVLPPPAGPLEGNSLALPAVFDIILMGGDCYVQDRSTGTMYPLTGVECRSAPSG